MNDTISQSEWSLERLSQSEVEIQLSKKLTQSEARQNIIQNKFIIYPSKILMLKGVMD